MNPKRLSPAVRQAGILNVALMLAEQRGYTAITRDEVAEAVGVRGPLLHYYFGTMKQFRRELMRWAILTRNLRVVAQGLAVDDPQAVQADDDLRRLALDSLQ